MSSGTSSRLPDREGSDATTCAVALDPLGGLRCAVCHTAPDPASLHGGLWAAMRHVVLCGPRASCMKKSLAGLLMWRGLPVPNARAHISKVPDVRAIIGQQDVWAGSTVHACKMCGQMATVWLQCSASTVGHSPGTVTVPGNQTSRCHAADRVRCGRMTRPDVPTPLKTHSNTTFSPVHIGYYTPVA
jgi:hypothetical protein